MITEFMLNVLSKLKKIVEQLLRGTKENRYNHHQRKPSHYSKDIDVDISDSNMAASQQLVLLVPRQRPYRWEFVN